jgi:cytochrome c-type biogenesis protein CcmE
MAQPQGLLQSESIVIDGSYKDGAFHASDMLLKCPSKYNSENHLIADSE